MKFSSVFFVILFLRFLILGNVGEHFSFLLHVGTGLGHVGSTITGFKRNNVHFSKLSNFF